MVASTKPDPAFLTRIAAGMLAQAAGVAAGYLFQFVMARTLSTAAFGHLAITLTLVAIAITIASLGLPILLVRFIASEKATGGHRPGVVWSFKAVSVASLLIGAVFAASAWPLGTYVYKDAALVPFLVIGALIVLPGAIVQLAAGALQGSGRSTQATLFRSLYGALGVTLVFLLLHPFFPGPLLAMVVQLIVLGILSLFGAVLVFGRRPAQPAPDTFPIDDRREMLGSGLALVWAGTAGMLLGWADTLMLGYFAGAAVAGIYALAFRIAILGNQVYIVCQTVLSPHLAQAFSRDDRPGQQRVIGQMTHYSLAGSLAFAILALLFAGPMLQFFGPEYGAGAAALRIVAAGELAAALFGASEMVMQMTGLERALRNRLGLFLLVNIALNLLLIPRYGMVGAALATAITNTTLRAAMAAQVYRQRNLNTLVLFSVLRQAAAVK